MREYVKALVERFGNAGNLARFMGCSIHTVHSWTQGKRKAQGVDLRMLQVLGKLALDAPDLFDTLTGPRVYLLPYLPRKVRSSSAAWAIAQRLMAEQEQAQTVVWDDAYFFPRTSAEEHGTPLIPRDEDYFRNLSPEEETEFWRVCIDYEKRTGRFFPLEEQTL